MISRYDVALNDVHMAEIDENLLILDVQYETPKVDITSKQVAGRDGGIVTKKYKGSASVTITFELHIYGIAERQAALQNVISWAMNGGILTTNDREEQQLNCICSQFPAIESALNWTDPLTIVFTAYMVPFWEDSEATVFTISGANPYTTKYINGNGGDTLVSCSITARGKMNNLRVQCGSSVIELTGLNINNGSMIDIYYNNRIIVIISGSTSLLSKRTGTSSDELTVPCGQNSGFGIISNVNVTATFSVRGRWM